MRFGHGATITSAEQGCIRYLLVVDLLILAGDAAAILDRLGINAYGKRADGRVTIDGWAQANGKRIAFSYEVDEETSPNELAERCVAKVRAAIAGGE